MINKVLLDMGFEPLEAEYKKTVRGMVNGVMKDKHYLNALYVDDLIIACTFKPSCAVIASSVRIDVNLHTGLYVSE